ncbi:hypothetical protein [Rickettsiales endosymbiont of Trichoplax sp. H2]|uniref:IS1/IS1595 family N-terminal zinc-binding domain-containing protein n=1 Tax=Rickettsiales endosymbiont of Trichoplax sp. H2 TaxID=2021221 RepID=UPI0012B3EA8F|nr:hypothetical protein [Rickettsiales endosymbiont of Trichoplax sp. H2]
MGVICKKCQSNIWINNGKMKKKQRYRCKRCGYNYTMGDKRVVYENRQKELVIRMYLNNCGIRIIADILKIPLSTEFSWIKKAGQIVEEMVKEKEDRIEILELDELYTYIKKT